DHRTRGSERHLYGLAPRPLGQIRIRIVLVDARDAGDLARVHGDAVYRGAAVPASDARTPRRARSRGKLPSRGTNALAAAGTEPSHGRGRRRGRGRRQYSRFLMSRPSSLTTGPGRRRLRSMKIDLAPF